jgi:hypothetical protein
MKLLSDLRKWNNYHRKYFTGFLCLVIMLLILITNVKGESSLKSPLLKSTASNTPSEKSDENFEINQLKIDGSKKADFYKDLVFILKYSEISIFSFKNPKAPKKIGSCLLEYSCDDFVVNENYLISVTSVLNKLEICTYDLTNIKTPKLVNKTELEFDDIIYFKNVALSDNKLFIIFSDILNNHRLVFCEIDNGQPSDIVDCIYESNYPAIEYQHQDLFITEKYVFISTSRERIDILDISDRTNIRKIYNYSINIQPNDIAVKNDFLYIADDYYGLMVFSFESRDYLEKVYQFGSSVSCEQLLITNNLIIAYQDDLLVPFNITTPTNPILMSQEKVPFESEHYINSMSLYHYNDILLLFQYKRSLLFYDISNPLQIRRIMNITRFLAYFGALMIVLIVPIFYAFTKIKERLHKKEENFSTDKHNLQPSKEKDLESPTSSDTFQNSKTKDNSETQKSDENDEKVQKSNSRLLDIIWFKPYHYAFLLLFIQNILFIMIIPLAYIFALILLPLSTDINWTFYFLNAPLILDLVVGVAFIIASVYNYKEKKNNWALLSIIFWSFWIVLALAYRILIGMPDYSRIFENFMPTGGGYNFNFRFIYLLSNVFLLSLVIFWFAFYTTDQALEEHLRPKSFLPMKVLGSVNLFFGVLLIFLFLFNTESVNFSEPFYLLLLLILILACKFFLVPVFGIIISILNKTTIDCSKLSEESFEKNKRYCEGNKQL